jgi:hypothetical protein
MTAQIPERMTIDGRPRAMCSEPLSSYFALLGAQPRFESTCTALWRGYVGHWELIDRRLYLVRVDGRLEEGSEASLATFFPKYPQRVFAHWYTGTLRIPEGRELTHGQMAYPHAGNASVRERDQLILVVRGVAVDVDVEIRINGTAPDDANSIDGFRVGAMTVFVPIHDTGDER